MSDGVLARRRSGARSSCASRPRTTRQIDVTNPCQKAQKKTEKRPIKKASGYSWPQFLVEAAGIEPTSALLKSKRYDDV